MPQPETGKISYVHHLPCARLSPGADFQCTTFTAVPCGKRNLASRGLFEIGVVSYRSIPMKGRDEELWEPSIFALDESLSLTGAFPVAKYYGPTLSVGKPNHRPA